MLKRPITYTDYNDETVTDICYFNLSKSELVEMEVSTSEGFGETLKRIVKAEDTQSLVATFKKIILSSYGKKSDDGKRFIKNDELREEFSQTAAYNALFMELATNESAAVDFIRGVIPSDMSQSIDAELKAASNPTPILPPPAA